MNEKKKQVTAVQWLRNALELALELTKLLTS